MQFKWVDYCEKYEDEIETWNHDELVARYVIAEGTKADYLTYLSDERFKEFELGKGYFFKVVLEEDVIIGTVMIFRSEKIPTTIEHFIVNPKYKNKGYGTKIIKELVNNISNIIGFDDKYFHGGGKSSNKASIRVWEKCGFTLLENLSNEEHLVYHYTKK